MDLLSFAHALENHGDNDQPYLTDDWRIDKNLHAAFSLGKLTPDQAPSSDSYHVNCKGWLNWLQVARVGSGLTAGYNIPLMLTHPYSAFVIDLGAEHFKITAARRGSGGGRVTDCMGGRVIAIDPTGYLAKQRIDTYGCEVVDGNDLDFLTSLCDPAQIVTVYLILPKFNATVKKYAPEILKTIMQIARQQGKSTENRCLLILDHFYDVGYIPGFDHFLFELRALGFAACIAIHSMADLQALYPKEQWKRILEACDLQTFSRVVEPPTASYLAKVLDIEEPKDIVFSTNPNGMIALYRGQGILLEPVLYPDRFPENQYNDRRP